MNHHEIRKHNVGLDTPIIVNKWQDGNRLGFFFPNQLIILPWLQIRQALHRELYICSRLSTYVQPTG
jgi:hypothetical protein